MAEEPRPPPAYHGITAETQAEILLINEFDRGLAIQFGDGRLPKQSDDDRRIRGKLLRALILGLDPNRRGYESGMGLYGAWIDGPLDLEGCKVASSIGLAQCHFTDAPHLTDAEIGAIYWICCDLPGCNASRLTTRGNLDLSGTRFRKPLDISGSRIGGELVLSEANEAVFQGDQRRNSAPAGEYRPVVFDAAQASAPLEVLNHGAATPLPDHGRAPSPPVYSISANHARIGSVGICGGRFPQGAALIGAQIEGDFICLGTAFGGSVSAASDDRSWALNLDRARIEGALILRQDMAGSEPREVSFDGLVDLSAARIGLIVAHDQGSWPPAGRLMLDRAIYAIKFGDDAPANIALDWLGRQVEGPFLPQPFDQMARALREIGQEEQAKTVLIAKETKLRAAEFERLRQARPDWPRPARAAMSLLHALWSAMLWVVGYGYRPERAFWMALALIVAFTGVIHVADAQGLMLPVSEAKPGLAAPRLVPVFYALESLVPLVRLGQADAFRPDMSLFWGYGLQIALWVYALIGWLLSGLLTAGVFGLFQRK